MDLSNAGQSGRSPIDLDPYSASQIYYGPGREFHPKYRGYSLVCGHQVHIIQVDAKDGARRYQVHIARAYWGIAIIRGHEEQAKVGNNPSEAFLLLFQDLTR